MTFTITKTNIPNVVGAKRMHSGIYTQTGVGTGVATTVDVGLERVDAIIWNRASTVASGSTTAVSTPKETLPGADGANIVVHHGTGLESGTWIAYGE